MSGPASQGSDDGTVIYRGTLPGYQDASSGSRGTIPTMSSSWDEEFGAGATAEVQRALDAVDGFLYEGTCVGVLGGELEAECQRWADAFVHLRAVGRGITPPTCVEPRSASPKENNSGSAQSNCEAEPAISPTEDPLKDEVADRLCALFWPEVTGQHRSPLQHLHCSKPRARTALDAHSAVELRHP